MLYYKKIEKHTVDILTGLGIKKLPIDVEAIAKERGLTIMPYDLGEEISGVLVIQDNKGTIGFNPKESKVRQRFTIAHELGHYELHKNDATDLFVDKDFKMLFRDQKSSQGTSRSEQEANAFAAALLMPEKILLTEIKNHHFHLTDDGSIKELANLFHVSVSAMTLRMVNLNLFMKF